jgi:phosphoserine phosphatase
MGRPAAFFRLEGPLSAPSAARAAAWIGGNAQHLSERALRFGAALAAAPLAGALDGATAGRFAWAALRETSEDRLRVLGEEYAEEKLVPTLRPVGLDLFEQCRRDGCLLVVVSDSLREVADVVGRHLRADVVVANAMEIRNGRATGRLVDPVVGRFGGERLRSLAGAHDVDLSRARAYGSAGDDQLLLAAVGLPCAVAPDRALRRVARDLDWPIVEDR